MVTQRIPRSKGGEDGGDDIKSFGNCGGLLVIRRLVQGWLGGGESSTSLEYPRG